VSARKADADGNGTAAGRGNFGPIPIAFAHHPAIPDQFTHVCNSAPKILFFNRVIRLFSFLCGNSSQVPIHQELTHKIAFFPIVPDRA
jgi:hypothetical protein